MAKLTSIFKTLTAISTVGMLLLPSVATAENLLVNGDFEADPYPIGNHVHKSVTGWHAGEPVSNGMVFWPLGNVVGVDGDGPSTWGTPTSDATGGNNLQHYLDGYGETLVWQHFTAPCSGRARASMSYSVRDGEAQSSAKFSWEPRMGSPVSLPIPGSTVNQRTNIPAPGVADLLSEANYQSESFQNGTPENRWTEFQYTKQLVGGQLYTFLVDLDQRANLDNASVEMVDACEAPLDTQETSIQKACEAPVAGVHNGVLGQNLSCQINVNATPTPFSGTLTVTDAPSQSSGNTSGTVISMTSASGNFDCSAPDSCTIDGSNFTNATETINVQTFIQTTGPLGTGSSSNYSGSNCVSGSYQNGDDITALNGNCVNVSFRPRISSTKVCEPVEAVVDGPMTLNCAITVNGSNLASTGYVQVLEFFGVPTTAVTGPMVFTSNEDWNCIVGPGQPNGGVCEIPTIDLFNAGGTSTIDVSIPFEFEPGTREIYNCAPSQYGATSYIELLNQNNSRQQRLKSSFFDADYCVKVEVPPKKLPPLKEVRIEKSCGKPELGDIDRKPGLFWDCTITVQANPVPFSGVFELDENASAFSGSGSGDIVSVSPQNNAWSCQQNLPSATTSCEIDGADFSPTGTEIVNFKLFAPIDDNKPIKWENCVTGKYRPYKEETHEMGGDCDTMSWTPLPILEKVELTKSCTEPKEGEYGKASGLIWQCSINVQAVPAPFDGEFSFIEDATALSGSNNGNIINVNHSNQAWSCLPNAPVQATTCTINGANFSSNGSETVTFDLFVETGEKPVKWENCVSGLYITRKGEKREVEGNCETMTWKPSDDTTYDIKKICTPRGDRQNFSDTAWIQAYRCEITVTTNGVPFSGPLIVQDNLTVGGAPNPQVINGMSSSDPWNCTQPSYTLGNEPGCWISGSQFPHSNGSSTINVDLVISSGMVDKGVENCSTLSTIEQGSDKPKQIGKSCTPIGEGGDPGGTTPSKRNLKITKTQRDSCTAGSTCRFHINVLNTGDVAMNIPQIVDQITPHTGVTVQSSSLPWVCSVSSGNVICNPSTPMTLQPGSGMTMTVNLNMPRNLTGKVGNCARLNWMPYLIPYHDRSLRSVQQALTNKGFKPGPVDGAMGQLTRDAIRRFERQNGLPVTGEVNEKMATLLFGVLKPLHIGDDVKADDNSCINVEYKPADPVHDRRQSFLEAHDTYRSSLVEFHRQYKSSLHDGKSTKLRHDRRKSELDDHDRRVSRVHRRYKSSQHDANTTQIRVDHSRRTSQGETHNKLISRFHRQFKSELHNARTTRIVVEHNRKRSQLEEFHKKFKSSQHDGRRTRLRKEHSKSQSALREFHKKFKSSRHDGRSTRLRKEHSRSQSALREFHKKFKSSRHDGRRTRLRKEHSKSQSALREFHKKFKSSRHDGRSTRLRKEHSRSQSALREFHKKFKSSRHDGRSTRLRKEHSKSQSALREFHKKFKSSRHDGRSTRLRKEHSKSQSALREFHKKFKSSRHDGRSTRLRKEHSRSQSALRAFHKKFKSIQHDSKSTGILRLKPRALNPAGQIKK